MHERLTDAQLKALMLDLQGGLPEDGEPSAELNTLRLEWVRRLRARRGSPPDSGEQAGVREPRTPPPSAGGAAVELPDRETGAA